MDGNIEFQAGTLHDPTSRDGKWRNVTNEGPATVFVRDESPESTASATSLPITYRFLRRYPSTTYIVSSLALIGTSFAAGWFTCSYFSSSS